MKYYNPYQRLSDNKWRKMNLHSHAGTGFRTCGQNRVEAVVDLYRELNYEFLCISNHDYLLDATDLTNDQMLMVNGVEYSIQEHMLTIGVDRSLHTLPHQEAIDETNRQGGFVILCHPNWQHPDYWSKDRMLELNDWIGIEALNWNIYTENGSGLATDKWDMVLSHGRKVFAFGNDDFHSIVDLGRSFTLIHTNNRTYEGLIDAVLRGHICASTGMRPVYQAIENDTLNVKATYMNNNFVENCFYRFIGLNGKVLFETFGSEAKYTLKDEEYVRVEAYGENGAMALFQPIMCIDAFPDAFDFL